MKSKIIIIALSVLLAISLCLNIIMIHRESRVHYHEEISIEPPLQPVDTAPDFSVQLLTGETFTLSDHIGTVVVLDFWATWCGPCVQKMPAVQELSDQFENDVIFVGMNVGEPVDRVQSFITERGFTYPIGLDENGDIHRNLYPSPGIPYMVIINREGVITETILGGGASMRGTPMYDRIENAILEALR